MKLRKAEQIIRKLNLSTDEDKKLYAEAIRTITMAVKDGYSVVPLEFWLEDLIEKGDQIMKGAGVDLDTLEGLDEVELTEREKKELNTICSNLLLLRFIIAEANLYEAEEE